MKVLVIGGGGREHALAWRFARSERVSDVYVAPGNAGTRREPGVHNVAVGAEDITALVDFARNFAIDLTVVGPEVPLTMGVVDAFRAAGLRCLGPDRAAAELEGSKAFAKAFLERHRIPTAGYRVFDDLGEARDYIREHGAPLVVKADGLAAGKGVTVAMTVDEALQAAEGMLGGNAFGDAGERIVVEDFLQGEEASFIALVDGNNVLPLASSQDHKARDDGDTGPNTGGMGAYSPAPIVTGAVHERILEEIVRPTVRGLAAEGRPYTGFLYAGVMIDPDGEPRVLEFNVRLGDPETQPILMRLRSDLPALCDAALDGCLAEVGAEWDPRPCLGVVMAAGGYPGAYGKGDVITGLPESESGDVKVFHAGTSDDDAGEVVTMGGRVLCVCALGSDIAEARNRAYEQVERIHWDGVYYRRDIGHRAVARLRGGTPDS
ncbi:Phosphoribosylamine--glycine ligase [wastewater metagenome]|uniref:Phosphoribosylamine--glycine ligase n=2 Tax=unclassified sequences TaxID=12908 RepID=A0A5B8RAU0_9ZZZZ|nr:MULTISPECIES: phosphoribosylamine--glycine ligase [Arhodomonas]MCS4503464.1 phosphoribosylamine--glycine ligase [Arhodomonas aquaeolei]QEA05721.1 phosphoribosylamine--glycine ligase [uncultured organism]